MPRSAILTSARAVFRSYAAKCKALPRGAVRAWNSLFLHFSDQFRDVDDLPLAALITPEKPQAAQLRKTELARVGASFVREVENILETCWGSMFRAFLTFGMHKQRHAVGRLPPSNHARAWSTSRRCSTTFSTTSPAKSLGRVASCSS